MTRRWPLLALTSALAACGGPLEEPELEETGASPAMTGWALLPDGVSAIEYELVDGAIVLGDDMVLDAEHVFATEQEAIDASRGVTRDLVSGEESIGSPLALSQYRLWPNRTIVYAIEAGYSASDLALIEEAMAVMTAQLGARFVRRTNQRDYVLIASRVGCYSYLGKGTGRRILSLQRGVCMHQNIVIHELLHAFGFVHEQQRPDRDLYVTIHTRNIRAGRGSNFSKLSPNRARVKTDYDYLSVMHYFPYHHSKNGLPTITRKDGSDALGGVVLTASDVLGFQAVYGADPVAAVAEETQEEAPAQEDEEDGDE